jgi:hypothetical protein
MRRDDRYIVVEAPPVSSDPDVYALAHVADTVVLVAEIRRTRREQILDGVQYFEKIGDPIPGVVLVPVLKAPSDSTARHRPAATESTPEPHTEAAAQPAAVSASGNGAGTAGNGGQTNVTVPFARIIPDASGKGGEAQDAADSGATTAEEVPSSRPES